MAVSFANNNLNGHTRFLEGYISSKTRVCVTVGMMTTGYDCEDLLNIVLLRPIFSPTDFIQIKGRGTRKYTFRYTEKEGGQVQEHAKPKEKFKLFDFFAVCEYFEEKFNYDEVIELPPIASDRTGAGPPPPPPPGPTRLTPTSIPTRSSQQVEYAVPVYGMKIDRKFFEKFEDQGQGHAGGARAVRARRHQGRGGGRRCRACSTSRRTSSTSTSSARPSRPTAGSRSARSWPRPSARLTGSRPRTNCWKKNWRSSFPSTNPTPPTCRSSGSSSRRT